MSETNENKEILSQILVPVETVQPAQLVSEGKEQHQAIVAPPLPQAETEKQILQPPEIQPSADVPINTSAEPVQAAELIEKRGRGRPKGSKSKTESTATPATPDNITQPGLIEEIPAAPTVVEVQTDYRQLSQLTCDMGSATLSVIFGDEWRFEDEQERESIVGAVEHYFKAKQVKDIPPGALLCIVVSTYAAKRFQKPKTANKIKLGWYWLKNKFSRKKKTADVVAMPSQI
jgi:hypothetical protein